MNAQDPAKLQEVKRVSRLLQRFFRFLLALTVLSFALVMLTALIRPSEPGLTLSLAGIEFEGADVTGRIRVLAAVSAILGLAVSLKAFYHLIKLFGLYAAGFIFTVDNVRQIRQLGVTLLLFSVVWLFGFIGVLPDIASNIDEWGRIVPSFPTLELVGGGIVILISWIMDVGRELREEHDLVV